MAPSGVELYVVEGGIMANRNNSDDYYEFVQKLIDDGQRPDGIAFMGHFEAGGLRSMDYLYESMDRFAPLADEIQITELDVNAPGDEQLQADYLRDVMIMAISHPKMGGITHWGFWAGRHWKPTAALWRTDWSIRPAGQAYLDLVFNQWWTNETGKTNDSGLWSFHGFHGDYEVTVQHEGKTSTYTFRLKEGAGELDIRLE